MQTKGMIAIACASGLLGVLIQPEVQAGKPRRQLAAQATQIEPTPTPVLVHPGTHVEVGPACCEHKCCKRRDRKCKHSCEPVTCAPTIQYKGCPAPCSVTKVVTVTHPKTCVTLEVPIEVPAGYCEQVDHERDGDMELDYGKYEVRLRWRDGGRRLVVDYDD